MRVGVIGIGVVGKPLYESLKYYHGSENVTAYDKYKPYDKWEDILKTDICFICLPTDGGEDGRLDVSVVDDTVNKLFKDGYNGLLVIKSTLRLGYISELIKRYQDKHIAVFPEWLYADNAFPDTIKPEMTVIGVPNTLNNYASMILEACPWHHKSQYHIVLCEEAVMIKLTANALASTKISFANQIGIVCEKYDIDKDKVMNAIKTDPRCAPRYLNPTGEPYGGYCLPKDTKELAYATDKGDLLKAVDKFNEGLKK